MSGFLAPYRWYNIINQTLDVVDDQEGIWNYSIMHIHLYEV